MASGRKFDEETKARVIRMYLQRREEVPMESGTASRKHVGALLGVSATAMRPWITRYEIDSGTRAGTGTVESDLVRKLRRENAELRRANSILKAASAFFAAEIDRPHTS